MRLYIIIFVILFCIFGTTDVFAAEFSTSCDEQLIANDMAIIVKDSKGAIKRDSKGAVQYLIPWQRYGLCSIPDTGRSGEVFIVQGSSFPQNRTRESAVIKGVGFFQGGSKRLAFMSPRAGATNTGGGEFTSYFTVPDILTAGTYEVELLVTKKNCIRYPCTLDDIKVRRSFEVLAGKHSDGVPANQDPNIFGKGNVIDQKTVAPISKPLVISKIEMDKNAMDGSSYTPTEWELIPRSSFTLLFTHEGFPSIRHSVTITASNAEKSAQIFSGDIMTDSASNGSLKLTLPPSLTGPDTSYTLLITCTSNCTALGYTEARQTINVRENLSLSLFTDFGGGKSFVARKPFHVEHGTSLVHVFLSKPDLAYSKKVHIVADIDDAHVFDKTIEEIWNVTGSTSFDIQLDKPLKDGAHRLVVRIDAIESCDRTCKPPYSRSAIITVDPSDPVSIVTYQPASARFGKLFKITAKNLPPNTRVQGVGTFEFEGKSDSNGLFSITKTLDLKLGVGRTEQSGGLLQAFNIFQVTDGTARTFTINKDIPFSIPCASTGKPTIASFFTDTGANISGMYDLGTHQPMIVKGSGLGCFTSPEMVTVAWKGANSSGSARYKLVDAKESTLDYPFFSSSPVKTDNTGSFTVSLLPTRETTFRYFSPDFFIRNGYGDVTKISVTLSSGIKKTNTLTIPVLQQYALALDEQWLQEDYKTKNQSFALQPGTSVHVVTRGFQANSRLSILDVNQLKNDGFILQKGWTQALNDQLFKAFAHPYLDSRSQPLPSQKEYPLSFNFRVPDDAIPGPHTYLIADANVPPYSFLGTESTELLQSLHPRGVVTVIVAKQELQKKDGEIKDGATLEIKKAEPEKSKEKGIEEQKKKDTENTINTDTSQKFCDQNTPRFSQGNCIEKPIEATTPEPPKKCADGIPRYAQPNCFE